MIDININKNKRLILPTFSMLDQARLPPPFFPHSTHTHIHTLWLGIPVIPSQPFLYGVVVQDILLCPSFTDSRVCKVILCVSSHVGRYSPSSSLIWVQSIPLSVQIIDIIFVLIRE